MTRRTPRGAGGHRARRRVVGRGVVGRGVGRERGSAALELAIVAPALLALIFFSLQAAFFFYGRTAATHAAREGVSQLRLAEDAGQYADLQGPALQRTERFAASVGGAGLVEPQATSTYEEQGDGTARVSVTVTGRVITLVPGLRLTASADASGTVERFLEPELSP
ncbi:TadE family protein [Ornithinimicrobium flavum]|uniref:TadE family protein n=1 Tax=Ornithinimicrobium flavum TaxID=1288636 RepID=UPI00106FF42F|nr:TadE family protein [Ornithinimicrobium flavum]